MLGVGAKHIKIIPVPPPDAATILTYASIVFVSVLSWCTMTPDYGVYHAPASSWRIGLYVYLGFFVGSVSSFTFFSFIDYRYVPLTRFPDIC